MPRLPVRWGGGEPTRLGRNLLFASIISALPLITAGPASTAQAAPTAPRYATSYYMRSVNPSTAYTLGCSLGSRDLNLAGTQDSLVILHFGMPRYSGGLYGTSIFTNSFASTAQIAGAAEGFAKGYWNCSGSDTTSHLRIALGTSNYGSTVSYAHGQAWARMVNDVSAWLSTSGYASQVDAVGASDMEMAWNSPAVTRAWVNGYGSAFTRILYDFGDAGGCPPYGSCGGGGYVWSSEDVWYISWGAPSAWPIPEIYLSSGGNAQQWYRLSLYAYLNHGMRMNFHGVLTQYQACVQNGCSSATFNSPATGWSQLWDALNADARTAQNIRWSTDIKWQ